MGLLRRWNGFRAGYLRVRVTGGGTERFLNLCMANGIECWDLDPCPGGAVCRMTVPAFRRIRQPARKAGVTVRILGRYGLPFFLSRNRKRKGLAAGFAAFFALLYVMSLFVWNITFEGNYHYSRDTLLTYLDTLGIRYGMLRKDISCENLEESLRSAFPEITWVSAGVSGTMLSIRVKENEALSQIPQKDDSPCQLTAGRSGTVTRMIVRQGKAMVSPGDPVEKDQVLISSQLSVMNDDGQPVRTVYVHADGDVYARTEYMYRKAIDGFHTVSADTGRKRYGVSLSAGDAAFRILTPGGKDRQWEYVSESRQLRLFGDFYLPVYGAWIRGQEQVFYQSFYTEAEMEAIAGRIQEQYLENLIEKGVHIIENNVKIQRDGLSYTVEGTVTAEENIARVCPVEPAQDEE